MSEKNNKIDINGSIIESATGLAWTAFGVILIGVIVLCLIAPVLAPFIQGELETKPNGGLKGPNEMPKIWAQMVLVKIGLWIIAIISWILVILCNIYWK